MNETYTPGYSASAVHFMARRSAEKQARFILPWLKPGFRLLDLGCGPGTITAGLAQAVAPGEVIGYDQAESQLNLARERMAKAGLNNVRFVQGSIYELPFDEAQFDVVFAHAVFEHLKNPATALREIHRVLKPGGLVALRSPDWGGFIAHPLSAELTAALVYYQQIQTANGGDVHAGRKLKEWAEAAGFQNAKWSGSFEFVDELEAITEYLACQLEINPPDALPENLLAAKQLESFATALRSLPRQPGALFAGSWGELIASKSGGQKKPG